MESANLIQFVIFQHLCSLLRLRPIFILSLLCLSLNRIASATAANICHSNWRSTRGPGFFWLGFFIRVRLCHDMQNSPLTKKGGCKWDNMVDGKITPQAYNNTKNRILLSHMNSNKKSQEVIAVSQALTKHLHSKPNGLNINLSYKSGPPPFSKLVHFTFRKVQWNIQTFLVVQISGLPSPQFAVSGAQEIPCIRQSQTKDRRCISCIVCLQNLQLKNSTLPLSWEPISVTFKRKNLQLPLDVYTLQSSPIASQPPQNALLKSLERRVHNMPTYRINRTKHKIPEIFLMSLCNSTISWSCIINWYINIDRAPSFSFRIPFKVYHPS